MDSYQHPKRNNDQTNDETEKTSGLVPIPHEGRQPPPRDIDERESRNVSADPIELPAHEERVERSASDALDDRIHDALPLPTDEAHHDDDNVAPDPYDVHDQIDLTIPRPTDGKESHLGDLSTPEDLDVNAAPADRNDAPDQSEGAAPVSRADRPQISSSRLDDDAPVNEESEFFPLSYTQVEPQGAIGEPEVNSGSERIPGATAPPADGTATCPVCGRQTDALRFCGYCGASLTSERPELTSSSVSGRIQERARMLLDPLADWTRPGTVRLIMAAGALLILISLLANNGAMALIFGSAIMPLILVFWCLNNDVFENESPVIIAGFGIAGTLLGAILGWLGSLIVTSSWFKTGVLNYGAAGFGGEFAERAGSPPFLVWTLVGIVFPLLALAAIIGGPLGMRQTITLRNEVMDGLTLGAVMGAGYSLGTAIVFAAPMLTHGGPVADASTWTLTTIGLAVIRPLIWTLCGGMLGAAAWRYLLTGRIGSVLIPATVGAAAPLLFTFMSIELSSTGLWPEIVWGVVMAAIVCFFYKMTMDQAIEQDRKVLGANDARVICPVCHQVTPTGQFCAHCGSALT